MGRTTKCHAKLVRADRLDTLVWHALEQLLHQPSVIPNCIRRGRRPHNTTSLDSKRNKRNCSSGGSGLSVRTNVYSMPIRPRFSTCRLQARRQKLAAELHHIAQESRQLAHTRQQSIHWQHVMDNTATFRQLLGENLAQLSFEERQAIAQCLISQVIVTGEAVDIHFVLPASTPQAARRRPKEPEGTPGHFYRLRLAHFDRVEVMAAVGG